MKDWYFPFGWFTIVSRLTNNPKIMKLNQFALMRGFQMAHSEVGHFLIDNMLKGEQGEQMRTDLKLKRIQFDTVPELYDQLESVCSLLNCSKREFLELAVRDAIERAEDVFMDSYKEATGVEFMSVYGVKEGV